MKLKHKTILGFVAVMSAVSMLCVGYSAWTFVSDAPLPEANGSIRSDDVIYSDDYISASVTEDALNAFTLTPYGFIDDNKAPHYTGSLVVTFTMTDKCLALAEASDGVLSFSATLSLKDGNEIALIYNAVSCEFSLAGDVTSNSTASSFTASFPLKATESGGVKSFQHTFTGAFTFKLSSLEMYRVLYDAMRFDEDSGVAANPFTIVITVSNETAGVSHAE